MKRSRDSGEGATSYTHTSDTNESSVTPAAKLVDIDQDALGEESTLSIKCSMPPHKTALSFRTYEEYETHYNKTHVNRCLECGRNLPSDHLLSVHIEECHDAFVAVRRDRGEQTYSCFVEGCEKKCTTPQKRRLHLIDKHMYPKNFFFAVTKEGVDGRISLLLEAGHRRRKPPNESRGRASGGPDERHDGDGSGEKPLEPEDRMPSGNPPSDRDTVSPPGSNDQVIDGDNDQVMEGLTGAMSALKFVPRNVRFGRGGRGTGFSKR